VESIDSDGILVWQADHVSAMFTTILIGLSDSITDTFTDAGIVKLS